MNYEQEFAAAVKEFDDWEHTPVGLMFLRIEAAARKESFMDFGLSDDEAFREAYESTRDRINTYIELSNYQ